MDKEAFDSKLKQVKRQKEEAEEELQTSAEKWRAEKRKLNSEIDRLEAALSDAKSAAARKRPTDSKGQGMDPAALAKMQEAAEEKIKKAAQEWEGERAKLKSQVNRLEGAVAEAIARSANPMRATQSVREQFEVELAKVVKDKTELEQAFLRLKTESEQEKLKMTGELVKLRRTAHMMGRPVPKEDVPEANPKVRDLEMQLKESLAKWNSEREKLMTEMQKLESASRLWDTERRQLNDHAGQLQEAFVQAQAKLKGYEAAERSGPNQDAKIEELQRYKETLERQAQETRNEWDTERRRLNSQVDRLEQQLHRMSDTQDRVSTEVVDQLRKQYEQKLQEAIQQKTQLAHELQKVSAMLESERARLSAEIAQKSDEGAKAAGNGGTTRDPQAIAAEVARVEALIGEIITVIDNPETELSTVIRKNVEKAELDAYLKGILFSLGK
jgi:DNA repair exonuclease SbcCD ATPase subunit